MRAVLFHTGMLAGITGTVFFGFGLVSLLTGDQVLAALVQAHGSGARFLALAVLVLDTLLSLAVLVGSLRIRTRKGRLAAGTGYLLLAPTFAWAAWDRMGAGEPLMGVLDVALPCACCLLLAGLCYLVVVDRNQSNP